MVVVPTGKIFPDGTPEREILTPPALSLAVAVPRVASLMNKPQSDAPAPVFNVMFAGAVIVGATVSLTVMETVASALVRGAEAPSPESRTLNLKLSWPL